MITVARCIIDFVGIQLSLQLSYLKLGIFYDFKLDFSQNNSMKYNFLARQNMYFSNHKILHLY